MICAILLAAGASRRMGTNKLLLPYGSESVIVHIVKTLIAGEVDQILVVTGHDPGAVHDELKKYPVTFAHNTEYECGMLSSVRCGIRSLPDGCESVLVALGDHPTLDAEMINRMLSAKHAGAKIVVPSYCGRRGHPLLFSKFYTDKILSSYDDTGLRGMLHEYDSEVVEILSDDKRPIQDMDTPDDYRNLLEEFRDESP